MVAPAAASRSQCRHLQPNNSAGEWRTPSFSSQFAYPVQLTVGCPGPAERPQHRPHALPLQDLADADAALHLGFTGSLSRVATFSAEPEVSAPEGEAGAGPLEAAGAASPWRARHSRNASLASQPSTTASLPSGMPAGEAGDDTVAAELAAAQQQIDDEVGGGVSQVLVAAQYLPATGH